MTNKELEKFIKRLEKEIKELQKNVVVLNKDDKTYVALSNKIFTLDSSFVPLNVGTN